MRIIRTFGLVGLCLFVLLTFAGTALAEPQTTCPVMGGKINKEIYVDYQGQRIYFCCEACPPEFKKDPEKYLAKLKDLGQEPEKIEQGEKEKKKEREMPEHNMDMSEHHMDTPEHKE